MSLQYIQDIQAKHLIIDKPSVLISYKMGGPAMDVFHFSSPRIVQVTNTTGKEPGICIDEDLLRRIKLARVFRENECYAVHHVDVDNGE